MKSIAIIPLLLICTACFANEIDKLRTNEDVQRFLATRVNKYFKEDFVLSDTRKHQTNADYGHNRFFKLDFDQNGLTDLIIDGARLIVVLDSGQNKYEVHELSSGAFFLNHTKLMQIDSLASPDKLIVQQRIKPEGDLDTLVYVFGDFIEYNPAPEKTLNFESIDIETGGCFGECPIFDMTINKGGSASFDAKEFNDKEGEFHSTLPDKELAELIGLLSYLKVETLKDRYQVGWTDDQTATLRIHYDGKTKTISDYGEIGTFGLRALYGRFFDFRRTIDWQKH